MCPLLFFTSDLLHLESNIYVGLLAYMRTHARQHLKLEVRHKDSHERIHTHTHTKRSDTRTQARTYMHARMYLHADTHLYPYTHARMYIYVCASIHTVQTQIRRRILWRLIRDSTVCFYNNILLLSEKKYHRTSLQLEMVSSS